MKYAMTRAAARREIENLKDCTAYFGENVDTPISYNDMYELFRYRCRFGEAETRVIIAALIAAGATFAG